MTNWKKTRGKWLLALGLALVILSSWQLFRLPDTLQYAVLAPAESKEEKAPSELAALEKKWMELRETLGDGLSASTLSAELYDYSFSGTDSGTKTGTLHAVDEGYFDVYPAFLLAGRLPNEEELRSGERVAVLDQELAFALFPTTEPTDGKVQIEGEWYEVIGVVRHSRSVGEWEECGAYVPVNRLAAKKTQAALVVLSGRPIPHTGASAAFRDAAQNSWKTGGTYIDLGKETMRAAMLPRLLFILAGLYLTVYLIKRLTARLLRAVEAGRKRLEREYLRDMLPGICLRLFLYLLAYAALLACLYGVMSVCIAPMLVFTEWIPEVIVEWSSLRGRFWDLVTRAAQPIAIQTPQMAVLTFYARLLHWGVLCLLTFLSMQLFRRSRFPSVRPQA